MSAYCFPIRDAEWHEEAAEEPWRKAEGSDAALLRFAIQQILDQALTKAWSVEAADSLERRFLEQAEKWQRETAHLSSPTQRIIHPSYQAILGMGHEHRWDVIRLLIRDLQRNRRAWFWALSYLAQDNPINPRDAGKMDKMIEAWVKWGKARGLL